MSAIDGNSHTGAGNPEFWEIEDFARLVSHFHFLLGVSVLAKGIDVRDQIEGNGVNESGFEGGVAFLAGSFLFDLMVQRNRTVSSGSRDRLVGGGKETL